MATKRKYCQPTIYYVPDISKVQIDEVLDSSWCFKEVITLEDGVTIEFKAGNSVSKRI